MSKVKERNTLCYKESCLQRHIPNSNWLTLYKGNLLFHLSNRDGSLASGIAQTRDQMITSKVFPSLGFVFLCVYFILRQIPSMWWQRWPHQLSNSSRRKSICSENNVKSLWEDSGLAWITKQSSPWGRNWWEAAVNPSLTMWTEQDYTDMEEGQRSKGTLICFCFTTTNPQMQLRIEDRRKSKGKCHRSQLWFSFF